MTRSSLLRHDQTLFRDPDVFELTFVLEHLHHRDARNSSGFSGRPSGMTGGQETKLTKNEAAALATVAQMGVEVFTVRQLRSALGLSYQKTRRLLNGYSSRGTPYSGLLEKCPAISLYEATVTEDGGCGVTARRREQYFTLDMEVYRAWSGGASVWLDEDPDADSNDSSFQQNDSNCCHREEAWNGEDSGNDGQDPDVDRSMYVHVQQNERTESMDGGASGDDRGACVSRIAVIQKEKLTYCGPNDKNKSILTPLNDSNCCQRAETCCHSLPAVNPADYIPLPVTKDEPCHICGRRPTSSVRRGGGGLYLCYDCLKKARRPAEAQPLPGVLDHRTFERVKVELGRCDICDTAKAVYRSREAQAKGWEERLSIGQEFEKTAGARVLCTAGAGGEREGGGAVIPIDLL